jgi:hypothetical protein
MTRRRRNEISRKSKKIEEKGASRDNPKGYKMIKAYHIGLSQAYRRVNRRKSSTREKSLPRERTPSLIAKKR